MRSIIAVCLLVLLCLSTAQASCLNDFVECVRNEVDKLGCVSQLQQCANTKCSCFDIASVSTAYCMLKYNVYNNNNNNSTTTMSQLQSCLDKFSSNYTSCIQTCKQSSSTTSTTNNNFTGLHATQASIMSIFPHWSKATICKKVVGFIEDQANDKGCDYGVADLAAVCDILAPACYIVFKEICSHVLSYLEDHHGASAADICSHLGLGSSLSSSSEAMTSSSSSSSSSLLSLSSSAAAVSAGVVVNLNADGVNEFITRFNALPPAAAQVSSYQCWANNAASSSGYTCLEMLQLNLDYDSSSSSSSAYPPSNWGVVAAVFAILTFIVSVATFVMMYRRGNRSHRKQQQQQAAYVNPNNHYTELNSGL